MPSRFQWTQADLTKLTPFFDSEGKPYIPIKEFYSFVENICIAEAKRYSIPDNRFNEFKEIFKAKNCYLYFLLDAYTRKGGTRLYTSSALYLKLVQNIWVPISFIERLEQCL